MLCIISTLGRCILNRCVYFNKRMKNIMKDYMWNMQPNMPLTKQLAKRDVPALVYDAVNLEGVAMTLPEVQTILDGITVGGHRISDQNMAMNQAKTWEYIFDLVSQGAFFFNKDTVLKIHDIAGKEETLERGRFRSGYVSITGSEYEPAEPTELELKWYEVEEQVNAEKYVYDQAITAFYKWLATNFLGCK